MVSYHNISSTDHIFSSSIISCSLHTTSSLLIITSCLLNIKYYHLNIRSVYGLAKNHLDVGIWVSWLVGLNKYFKTSNLCLNDQAYYCLIHFSSSSCIIAMHIASCIIYLVLYTSHLVLYTSHCVFYKPILSSHFVFYNHILYSTYQMIYTFFFL